MLFSCHNVRCQQAGLRHKKRMHHHSNSKLLKVYTYLLSTLPVGCFYRFDLFDLASGKMESYLLLLCLYPLMMDRGHQVNDQHPMMHFSDSNKKTTQGAFQKYLWAYFCKLADTNLERVDHTATPFSQ